MVSVFGSRMDGGHCDHPASHTVRSPVEQLCCLSRRSSCPDFVKQLLSCVNTAWWGAARHGQTSSQLSASFTNEDFRQPCSSHGQWGERSTGGGWVIPCLLGCCHWREKWFAAPGLGQPLLPSPLAAAAGQCCGELFLCFPLGTLCWAALETQQRT